MSEGDKFELDRKDGMALDWRFLSANLANSSDGLVSMENSMNIIGPSSCSNSMVDSYGPNFLDLLPNSGNLGFCDVNAHQSNVSSSITDGIRKDGFSFVRVGHDDNRTLGMDWNLNLASSMMMKTDDILPNGSLSQFPTDSGFIDAVRMSCFSAAGGFGDSVNSCGIPQSMALHALGGCSNEGDRGESSADDGVGSHHDSQMLDCTSEEPSIKGLNPKKRKRKGQDNDSDKATRKGNCESRQKEEQQPTSTTKAASKKNAKQGSQASVPTDEGYVHVRARRGQATNSHSLAERVRREKISERMKFLQDLVPGCSKVTGKALMLDEIINYVQSLQQQAEFLSMKLASVNPHVDFNLEGLLPKDILQHRPGPSSALGGFLTEMPMTFPSSLHSPQPGLTRLTLPNMANSSDILERTVQQQGGFKEANQVNPLQATNH